MLFPFSLVFVVPHRLLNSTGSYKQLIANMRLIGSRLVLASRFRRLENTSALDTDHPRLDEFDLNVPPWRPIPTPANPRQAFPSVNTAQGPALPCQSSRDVKYIHMLSLSSESWCEWLFPFTACRARASATCCGGFGAPLVAFLLQRRRLLPRWRILNHQPVEWRACIKDKALWIQRNSLWRRLRQQCPWKRAN